MKHFLILFLAMLASGCGEGDRIVEHYYIFALTDSKFMVGDDVSDLKSAISYLGPDKNTLIGMTFCPGAKSETITKVITALKEAGYTKIGFTTESSSSQRELCSNYSVKGTAE